MAPGTRENDGRGHGPLDKQAAAEATTVRRCRASLKTAVDSDMEGRWGRANLKVLCVRWWEDGRRGAPVTFKRNFFLAQEPREARNSPTR
jgi:hypothetical protein